MDLVEVDAVIQLSLWGTALSTYSVFTYIFPRWATSEQDSYIDSFGIISGFREHKPMQTFFYLWHSIALFCSFLIDNNLGSF